MTGSERKILLDYIANFCIDNPCGVCKYGQNGADIDKCLIYNDYENFSDDELLETCNNMKTYYEKYQKNKYGKMYTIFTKFCNSQCFKCPFNTIDQYSEEEIDAMDNSKIEEIVTSDCAYLEELLYEAMKDPDAVTPQEDKLITKTIEKIRELV